MRSAHDLVVELKHHIENGQLSPGAKLPPERELAETYGLARNTVRNALRLLEEEGKLVRQVGRGTFVARGNGGSSLDWIMREASPADVMEVRLIIEPQVAALAAARATAEDLKALDHAFRQSLRAKGIAEFEHWDAALHQGVFTAARNNLLLDYCRAINQVRNQPQWFRLKQRSVTPETRQVYNQQHGDLVIALKERDSDAARKVMHQHLAMVRDNLLAIMNP